MRDEECFKWESKSRWLQVQGRRASAARDFSLYWTYPNSRYRVCVLMVMISASQVVSRTQKVPSSILGRLIFSPGSIFFCACRSSPTLAEQLIVCSQDHQATLPTVLLCFGRKTPTDSRKRVLAGLRPGTTGPHVSIQSECFYLKHTAQSCVQKEPPSCYRTVTSQTITCYTPHIRCRGPL